MESRLRGAFEYQKFDGNLKLQSVIDSVHSRYGMLELNLSDLEMVSAAGIPEIMKKGKNDPKDQKQ